MHACERYRVTARERDRERVELLCPVRHSGVMCHGLTEPSELFWGNCYS